MTSKTCDTCQHLKVPDNEDHARCYMICTVITPLPANCHVWFRNQVEGRIQGSERWIPRQIVEERPELLSECELYLPRAS